MRSLWKAVTLEDYQALAEGYPGVAKAKVLDTNACQNIRYYNVQLAIAPNGGGMPRRCSSGISRVSPNAARSSRSRSTCLTRSTARFHRRRGLRLAR